MRISSLFSGYQSLGLAFTLLLSACTPGSGADEPLGNAREAVFVNGGFETGGSGGAFATPPSWTHEKTHFIK
jgi:hypothetical protein